MWQIYGQEHITHQLDAALTGGRMSHACLLVGPPHVGKMTLAIGMAQAVNCRAGGSRPPGSDTLTAASTTPALEFPETASAAGLFGDLDSASDSAGTLPMGEEIGEAPVSLDGPDGLADETVPCGRCDQCQRVAQGIHSDLRIIGVGTDDEEGPVRRDIRIEQVREIESFLNLTPYEGSCKVVVVDGAELMNTAAANALLKTLEEPPPQSLLILLTANEESLLSTIRSRCSAFHLKPVAHAVIRDILVREHGAESETADRAARLSRGCFGLAVNLLRDSQAMEQRTADLARLQEVCEGGLDLRFDYANEVATGYGRNREAGRELLYLWLPVVARPAAG